MLMQFDVDECWDADERSVCDVDNLVVLSGLVYIGIYIDTEFVGNKESAINASRLTYNKHQLKYLLCMAL